MILITENNFEDEIAKSDTLCGIDLYADWCGPCRMLAPILDELESEYPNVKFCKINIDSEPSLARAFRVESIPLVAFVKNDTYLDMSLGLVPKSNLVNLIEQYK